jgi:hypothetical protein
MGNIKTTLTVTAPGGQKLTATLNKEANATVDREIVLNSGEFANVFNMDTESALALADPIGNSLSDYKQLIAYNSGTAPLEVALKTALYDEDGLTHAELYGYPVFFVPVGGYVSLPSPRMVTMSGVSTTPQSLSYITDVGGELEPQLNLRLFESTATYESLDGKIKKTGLSILGVTNGNGDLYLTSVHNKDASTNQATNGTGGDNSKTAATSIVPGTVRLQFYNPAYQEWNFTGNGRNAVTSSSTLGLSASTVYGFQLNVDGAGATALSFTTGTDITVGTVTGTGVLKVIQDEIDAHNLEADISIVDGNVRVTSRSRNPLVSAIAMTAPASGNDLRASGLFSASYLGATACVVSDTNDDDMMFDDGEGNLSRANGGSGWIRYGYPGSSGTRAGLYVTGAPAYSAVKVAWLHDSGSGGNLSSRTPVNDEKIVNSLLSVYARCLGYSTDKGGDGRKGKLRLIVVDNADINTGSY